jgi:hypothetical protein
MSAMENKMALTQDLIETILQRTREGKLDWSELSESGYIASIGPNSIVIDRDRTGGYALRITNERGKVIETAISASIAEGFSSTPLQGIYELARRQALHVNETLLDIKKNLEKL